jgi:hypothetical protein
MDLDLPSLVKQNGSPTPSKMVATLASLISGFFGEAKTLTKLFGKTTLGFLSG